MGQWESSSFMELRSQLKKDGRDLSRNSTSTQVRERLLHTLRTNDCREIVTAVVDGDDLASIFVNAGARGHVDVLEAFLNHGMNIDIKDEGRTALVNASYNGHEDEHCVRFLLDHHANVDVQAKNGETALMFASYRGHTKIVQMLLEKSANPDIQNFGGWTVLMHASLYGHKEIVRLLLNHNADIELKSYNGKTAFDLAKNKEIEEMIRNHVSSSYVLK